MAGRNPLLWWKPVEGSFFASPTLSINLTELATWPVLDPQGWGVLRTGWFDLLADCPQQPNALAGGLSSPGDTRAWTSGGSRMRGPGPWEKRTLGMLLACTNAMVQPLKAGVVVLK